MGISERFGAVNPDLAKAKRYIRSSGNGTIARSYFRETHCSVENAELDSRGLYCFEKVIRLAFIQIMKDDDVFGKQKDFIEYISGLNDNFDVSIVSDWRAEQCAARASDFMLSFYNIYSYQWKRHGRSVEKSLDNFLTIMRECLDFSYMRLLEKFDSLPDDIKANVDKAFFLTNSRIDEWHDAKVAELPAA